MRKGPNTVRNQKLNLQPCSHRVIIPLYIPNEEDYYQDAFKIFKMCLVSVQKTAVSPLKISVISNGCIASVNNELLKLSQEGEIDELIIETEAIGKINSILKALRTAEERLITITDADVLFLNNWEREVLNVFEAIPNAGMVSPVPMYRTQTRYTSNIWLRYLFSKKLRFSPVKNPEALIKFAKSVGWPGLKPHLTDVTVTLEGKNNILSVVGNAHFVGTYKNEIFKSMPKQNSVYKLGGNSERLYTDQPVLKHGGYRLATYDNFAYHMGNTIEPWMISIFENLNIEKKSYKDFENFKILKKNSLNYFLAEKCFKKLFYFEFFKRKIYQFKGLTKKQVELFIGGF
ncbi:glycosyltransferase family 2 protein [Lacinutrix sp. Hel_I_90]|uniref:glycosyltransferase family 2 protein n=1 Tax=Lacinutrix sp. Hel_I_90 TaxID=1249999 RepID=UPI0005C8D15B|nr:glycosyltransferase family 2 protein [Lacinutrix sp. Hel_I_90]